MSYPHPQLLCRVERIEVDFEQHRALIYLPARNYADMDGAIAVIGRIDPHCRQISAISDGLPAIRHVLVGKEWRAIQQPKFTWQPDPEFVRRPLWERSC